MQVQVGNEIHIAVTVSPFNSISKSSAIDRSASDYKNSREKIKKITHLISKGT